MADCNVLVPMRFKTSPVSPCSVARAAKNEVKLIAFARLIVVIVGILPRAAVLHFYYVAPFVRRVSFPRVEDWYHGVVVE